jgi:methenyltetrahydromethanopterin cyclohydrolase
MMKKRLNLSVNRIAWKLVEQLCAQAEEYGVTTQKMKSGTILIDAGIKAKGGYLAGKIITEICLGGIGNVEITMKQFGDLELPSIFVSTDHPAVAALGSQFAGWQIKVDKYFAIASGPARAIALKPKKLYEKIEYVDQSDVAVIVLETTTEPSEDVINYLCAECGIEPANLSVILVPTSSIAGSTQISGRIVETGIHKLTDLGIDPKRVLSACGHAPIAPVHPKFAQAMGRTNDAIMYAGEAYYTISYDDEEELRTLLAKAPSSASESHGKTFMEIFKEAQYDFYKIDPSIFAPAFLIVNNVRSGNTLKAGKIDVETFRRSIGL